MNPAEWHPLIWLALEAFGAFLILYWRGMLGGFGARPFLAPDSATHFRAGIAAARAEAEARHAKALGDQIAAQIQASFQSPLAGGPPAAPPAVTPTP